MRPLICVSTMIMASCSPTFWRPGATGVGNPGSATQQAARGSGVDIESATVYTEAIEVVLCGGRTERVEVEQEVDLLAGVGSWVPGGEWCSLRVHWQPPLRLSGAGRDEGSGTFDIEIEATGPRLDLDLDPAYLMNEGFVVVEVGFAGWIDGRELDVNNVDAVVLRPGDLLHDLLMDRADHGSALYADGDGDGLVDEGERAAPLAEGPLHENHEDD